MKLKAEITCQKCGREVRGTITLDETNHVFDSDGFMVFESGGICDTCLNEPGR